MVFILIYMLRDCLFAIIADMVFIRVFVFRDYLFAVVTDMVFILIFMLRDYLLAVITDMIFICVFVFRDCLFAVVTDMVFICVFVFRDYLLAVITDMIFIRIIMQTYISAFSAHTVFPFMCFTCHNHSTTAVPFLFVIKSGSCRPLLYTALVVCSVKFSVGFTADITYRLFGTGGIAA